MIPVLRGREWNKQRALSLPPGTPIKIVEHDEGEWRDALNEGVRQAETELVVLSAPDVWFQHGAVELLADLCWDVDVTWPTLVLCDKAGRPVAEGAAAQFCPNRLTRENYLNPVFCVRRDTFLKVGGVMSGLWDLQVRIMQAGGRFKWVPEAKCARDEQWHDYSPTPTPVDVKATFYHQATPGTAYWRCQLPARFLPGQAVFNQPFVYEQDDHAELANHAGAAVFQYAGDDGHHWLTRTMRQRNIRVLIEVDDDYTSWAKSVMRRAGWYRTVKDTPPGRYSVEQHRATVEQADGVIVTTERLAKIYRPLNPNVFVCPNQVDPADWPALEKPDDGIFRIGWFASASHGMDLDLVERAFTWAARQPDVEVNLIGIGRHPSGKPMYNSFPYKHFSWSNDLGVYKRFLLNLDVGVAPVVGNPWALCRSDVKALEYAMAGAMPIVSDREPYAHCEMPGMFRCHDAKSFLLAVQWAVANKDEVRALALEARDYVLAERTVEANIHRWAEAVAP